MLVVDPACQYATSLPTPPVSTLEIPSVQPPPRLPVSAARYRVCAIIGLGGLFAGVTGPLLSAFVPPLVQASLGDNRLAIGAVMSIDNVLLLALVPWAGPASDRAGRRMPFVLGGLLLAAFGMSTLTVTAALSLPLLITSLVLLYTGVNVQRSPFQALLADAVPSRDRSLASASVTFQMCVGAIAFLMLGRMLGVDPAFRIAAVTILIIALGMRLGIREPKPSPASEAEVSFTSLARATWDTLRRPTSRMRAIFAAALLLQLTFQTFTTWYALHATERFAIGPEEATIGFIAWAVGGLLGALPAGYLGVRLGRRNAILAGFALLAVCLLALDRLDSAGPVVPLLMLASAAWTLPTVNAYPLFIELVPEHLRGSLAALYLLSMALGGAIGDPLNGALFDVVGAYRPMFLMMVFYATIAFAAVLWIPRGVGEAEPHPNP